MPWGRRRRGAVAGYPGQKEWTVALDAFRAGAKDEARWPFGVEHMRSPERQHPRVQMAQMRLLTFDARVRDDRATQADVFFAISIGYHFGCHAIGGPFSEDSGEPVDLAEVKWLVEQAMDVSWLDLVMLILDDSGRRGELTAPITTHAEQGVLGRQLGYRVALELFGTLGLAGVVLAIAERALSDSAVSAPAR